MFFRANSNEQIERKGRYICIISKLHDKGIYQSKDILWSLFEKYLEYAEDPNTFRGCVFRQVDTVSMLKKTVETSSDETFAVKVIKYFNQNHLTIHPDDDIFYLISAFLSAYEYHLPKLNTTLRDRLYTLRERVSVTDKKHPMLVDAYEIMLGLMDKVFEKPREYQQYLDWLIEQFQHHQDMMNRNLLDVRIDYWQTTKEIFLDPVTYRLVNKKIRKMRDVLRMENVKFSIDLLLQEFERLIHIPYALKFVTMLDEIISLKKIMSEDQLKKVINILMKINDAAQMGKLFDAMVIYKGFFSSVEFQPLLNKIEEIVQATSYHRLNACRVLIAMQAVKNERVAVLVLSFLLKEITGNSRPDDFETLIACQRFFDLESAKKYRYRHPVIIRVRSLLADSREPIIRAEYVILLQNLNEDISNEGFFNKKVYIENIVNDLLMYAQSTAGDQQLEYVCKLLKMLGSYISIEQQEKIIDEQIRILSNLREGVNDKACFILTSLKPFIAENQLPPLFSAILKTLESPFDSKNSIFLNLVCQLKPLLSLEMKLQLANFILKKFCSGSDSLSLYFGSFSLLIREFRDYYSNEEIVKIILSCINSIRAGQHQDFLLYGDSTTWLDIVIFLKHLIPCLMLDQKIMFLDMLSREARRDNRYAHLMFADMYYYYREDVVKYFLLRRTAESGRSLPPEMVEHIVKFSYSGSVC